jgi:hypothetical protein
VGRGIEAITHDNDGDGWDIQVDLDAKSIRGQRRQDLEQDLHSELSATPEGNVSGREDLCPGPRVDFGCKDVNEPRIGDDVSRNR